MSDILPPAAALDDKNPPAVRLELQNDWKQSVQSVWEKIRSTQTAKPEDWKVLIEAERINRQMWIDKESEGTRRKKKGPSFEELMGSAVVDGQLKKTRAKRTSKKKVILGES